MKEIFTAASVEEAKQLAAQQFGTSEDKITFNVLEEPKKGLFGKVKGEAKVEAEYSETKTRTAATRATFAMMIHDLFKRLISAVPPWVKK